MIKMRLCFIKPNWMSSNYLCSGKYPKTFEIADFANESLLSVSPDEVHVMHYHKAVVW